MRMLDLFCGRWGWSKAFAARGWECIGIDLVEPPEVPGNCGFVRMDICDLIWDKQFLVREFDWTPFVYQPFDFICASPPCEQFSVHGMKHFHPNPPYPELGIKLFEHTRRICEESGVPYVIENVRAAQQFVGNAVHHCGPFYLWGTGVPPIIPKSILKGRVVCRAMPPNLYEKIKDDLDRIAKRKSYLGTMYSPSKEKTARAATIPPELASSVADYAERIIEQRAALR
jgi:hypothetical protein